MPARLTCPSCSAQLMVKDEYAGRAVRCPQCKAVIPPSAAPATPAAPPAPVVRPAPPVPRPNRPPVVITRHPTAPPPVPVPPPVPDVPPPLPWEMNETVVWDEAAPPPPLPPDPTEPPPPPPVVVKIVPPRLPARPPDPVVVAPPPLPPLPTPEPAAATPPPLPPPPEPLPPLPDEGIDLELADDAPARPAVPLPRGSAADLLPGRPDPDDDRPRARRRPPDREDEDDRPRRSRSRGRDRDDRDDDRPRDPRRRPTRRDDDDRPARKRSRLPLILGLVGGVLLLSCAGAAFGVYRFVIKARTAIDQAARDFQQQADEEKRNADRQEEAGPNPGPAGEVAVTAEVLGAAYGDGADRAAADARYKGRDLLMRGTVTRYDPPPGGFRVQLVTITPPGRAAPIPVYAHFTPAAEEAARRLVPGQAVTVRGRCDGFDGISVDVRGCTVTAAGVAPAPPPPAATVTAEGLARAFVEDSGAAFAKYAGKVLLVDGRSAGVTTRDGQPVLELETAAVAPFNRVPPVLARLAPGTPAAARPPERGTVVGLRGRCDGMSGDALVLSGCEVVRTGPIPDAEAARASAGDLVSAYLDDPARADARYTGRLVEVDGPALGGAVARASGPDSGPCLRMVGRPSPGAPGGVVVALYFDAGPAGDAALAVKSGQAVRVRGVCDGYNGRLVVVRRCAVVGTGSKAGRPDPVPAGPAGRPPAGVTTAVLIADYARNPTAADARYKGRVLTVYRATVESRADAELILVGPSSTRAERVKATLDPAKAGAAGKFKPGDKVAVRGTCSGLADGFVRVEGAEPVDVPELPADAFTVVSAADLLKAYAGDRAAADARYKGKVVEAAGVVVDVAADGDALVVRVRGVADAPVLACRFFPALDLVRGLGPGAAVTVRGLCDGSDGSAVTLSRCGLHAVGTPTAPPKVKAP